MPFDRNILVATGFNAGDDVVLAKAVVLARQNEAKLTVMAVAPSVPIELIDRLVKVSDIQKNLDKETKAQLEKVKESFDYPATFRLEHGGAVNKISDVSREINADLIIVGSHGSHTAQVLFGSTAGHVAHRADCDVMVIRAPVHT
jgi:universal stress protein A